MATTLMRMNTSLDVRESLPAITAPVLVLHRTGDPLVGIEHGRYLAERIPDARIVELPGADHWPWAGDADPIVGEIEEFVTGARGAPEPERILTTLLFTDIVSSTERATQVGDRRWRELLEDQQALVRREIGRFGGREIQTDRRRLLRVVRRPDAGDPMRRFRPGRRPAARPRAPRRACTRASAS